MKKLTISQKANKKAKLYISIGQIDYILSDLLKNKNNIKIITDRYSYQILKELIDSEILQKVKFLILKPIQEFNYTNLTKFLYHLSKRLYIKDKDTIITFLDYKNTALINSAIKFLNLDINLIILSKDIQTMLTLPFNKFKLKMKNVYKHIEIENNANFQINDVKLLYLNNLKNYYNDLFFIILNFLFTDLKKIDKLVKILNKDNILKTNHKFNYQTIIFILKNSHKIENFSIDDIKVFLNLIDIEDNYYYIYLVLFYLILINSKKSNILLAKLTYILKKLNIKIKNIQIEFKLYLINYKKILKSENIKIYNVLKHKNEEIKISPHYANFIYEKLNFIIDLINN